ncbi:MAG TPA: 23S rRNA (pseudouridine(1915)-N(3))-methyltransferase RlmH [Chthoniobacteraceae bacterium]|jgi:23S rRNA (pseudouridine1915-N3)-methyltransferase|nr:23S rRNA (pseudouridine(1915)-N(3))-methyltransferase RlmH [Chthoniobacteraceae bacterium]
MRWHIFAVGKPKLEFARLGIEDYAARLKPFAPVTLNYLKATSQAGESLALLERSKGMFRIVMDERGAEVSSRAFATQLSQWEMHGPRDFAVLVGGANGHDETVRQAAGWQWSLSRLTLQHELALLVALEQLYRAYTIKAGLPYHRE